MLASTAATSAPAPLARPARRPSQLTMAGTWDVKWSGMGVRLELRPDRSARFTYTTGSGTWDGSWRFNPAERQVILTLMINRNPEDYILTFDRMGPYEAEGKARHGSSTPWPVTMKRGP
jgi:hypothetical protein